MQLRRIVELSPTQRLLKLDLITEKEVLLLHYIENNTREYLSCIAFNANTTDQHIELTFPLELISASPDGILGHRLASNYIEKESIVLLDLRGNSIQEWTNQVFKGFKEGSVEAMHLKTGLLSILTPEIPTSILSPKAYEYSTLIDFMTKWNIQHAADEKDTLEISFTYNGYKKSIAVSKNQVKLECVFGVSELFLVHLPTQLLLLSV